MSHRFPTCAASTLSRSTLSVGDERTGFTRLPRHSRERARGLWSREDNWPSPPPAGSQQHRRELRLPALSLATPQSFSDSHLAPLATCRSATVTTLRSLPRSSS